jgi:alkylation response protein AidB-like acyl-CoA dehydrogenase
MSTPAARPGEYLERVRALAPVIAAEADQSERDRRLTRPLMDALHEAGLFRMLLPRSLDGGELDPATFTEVMEAVSRVDASTAWCLGQAAGCCMVAAYLEPAVAGDIFGRDQRSILAWGPGPSARAVAAQGGYRITGTWSFASGGRHATWLGGYCPIWEPDGTPRRAAGGAQEGRTMLFPARRATLIDVWNVIGLRGTGSDSYAVADLFVPHEYTVARDTETERRHPGLLYCFPSGSLYASGFSAVALGLARAALDAFMELARDKTPRGARHTVRESATVQSQVAHAEAQLSSARLYLMTSLREIWDAVGHARRLTLDQRARIRLAATYGIHQAKEVVDTIYHAAGSSAIFQSGPFERRFRDIHAVTQQLQGRRAHFETVGRIMFGLEPDSSFL